MPRICYETINFSEDRRVLIHQANAIIEEMKAQGYTLTLRQLYYQFVSRDIIPNSERSYKNLGDCIAKARMAGKIDWYAIEDRGRNLGSWLIQEEEQECLNGIEGNFALDFWTRQNTYVEVWVEKDALSSVISRPCSRRRVPYLACKGYLSASEAWSAGRRFKRHADIGERCVMIHLGDHDPSGIDMTRDNTERLQLFAEDYGIEVRRIALNMDQVEQYNPPPNPAKLTDKRADGYIARYGRSSWELDALEPRVIDELITSEIESLIDPETWNETIAEERERRKVLAKLHEMWPDIDALVRQAHPADLGTEDDDGDYEPEEDY